MKKFAFIVFVLASFATQAQDEKTILGILEKQTLSWNAGDLNGFMEGYWNNDSLMFAGKNEVTYGFKKVFNNYKSGYPDTVAMGKLQFDILQVKKISPEYYFVLGRWTLIRSAGNLNGHSTLLLRKIKGDWVIISDHSS